MKTIFISTLILAIFNNVISAQQNDTLPIDIEIIQNNPHTPIKNQYHSGTCWSFATTSFLESEILKNKKEYYDISEMYFVKKVYPQKAEKYIRYHGKYNFGPGGQAHDVIDILKKDGAVTETMYNGLTQPDTMHNHSELDAVLTSYLEIILKQKEKTEKLSTKWQLVFNAILDTYLGKEPKQIQHNNKTLTPKEFSNNVLELNANNYIELTSYAYQEFYTQIILEVPDNWTQAMYYNLPVNELFETIITALNNGYTFVWDGDVSNDYISNTKGLAELSKTDTLTITDNLRNELFNQQQAEDDHLMHIVGYGKDKNNKIFFIVKNSWSKNANKYNGYIYMSENYFKKYTVAVLLNKNSLPKKIQKKLKIK